MSSNDHTIRQLTSAIDLLFTPTPEQRRTKINFWVKAALTPTEPASISLAQAMQYTGDTRLEKWWSSPGFKEWFKNDEELVQRMDYLTQMALDSAEEMLMDNNPKTASARVNLLKLLLEARGRLSARQTQIKFADAQIGAMSPAELKSYITKQAKLIGV